MGFRKNFIIVSVVCLFCLPVSSQTLESASSLPGQAESAVLQYNAAVQALRQGDFPAAYTLATNAIAEDAPSPEVSALDFFYVAAISAFNIGNWREAEDFFARSMEQGAGQPEPEKAFFQRYYLGLAQFRQGRFEDAFFTLEPLLSQGTASGEIAASDTSLVEFGRAVAFHCVVQLAGNPSLPEKDSIDGNPSLPGKKSLQFWREKALALAQQQIHGAEGEGEKREAALQAAKLHRDFGDYAQALEILAPYTHGSDSLSLRCRFLQAEVLVSQGRLETAIQAYQSIVESFGGILQEAGEELEEEPWLRSLSPDEELVEKAFYRQGELLYSLGRYEEASAAFVSYRRNFPAGNYRDAALYFNGEALHKVGCINQAIVQHEALLKIHPASSFVFSSLVGLVDLYTAIGETEKALCHGNRLLEEFPQQAQALGIPGKLAALHLLDEENG